MFHHFPATFPQQLLSSVAPAGAFASKGAVAADFFPGHGLVCSICAYGAA